MALPRLAVLPCLSIALVTAIERELDCISVLKERWKKLVDALDACGEKPLRFLRYYIMAHYEIDSNRVIREDEIYEWLVAHAHECGIDTNPLGFLEQLIECSAAHAHFLACKNAVGIDNR